MLSKSKESHDFSRGSMSKLYKVIILCSSVYNIICLGLGSIDINIKGLYLDVSVLRLKSLHRCICHFLGVYRLAIELKVKLVYFSHCFVLHTSFIVTAEFYDSNYVLKVQISFIIFFIVDVKHSP